MNIAVILLNYNSEHDLFKCVEDLKGQQNVTLKLIIVDNASRPETVHAIKTWSEQNLPNVISGNTAEMLSQNAEDFNSDADVFIVYNEKNGGYSAGNNIGIKFAEKLGADAVMIANPDMRFPDLQYIHKLAETLYLDERYYIAAGRIIGLAGEDQNPFREATFFEELFWPRQLFLKFFKNRSYATPYNADTITTVPKVHGSCLMLRMSFLKEIGFLDETTFLYSEEPILAAQVREKQGKIVFNPFIKAIHAHKASEKGNSSKRMLLFIKSRKYYLKRYSGYSKVQLLLLDFSYFILATLHRIKLNIKK